MNNEPTQGTTHKLTKKERRNAAWRWSLIGSNNINYGTLQGTGYAWSMAKTLRKIYPNDNDYVEAMRVEYEYFNITPYMGPLVVGADVAMQPTFPNCVTRVAINLDINGFSPCYKYWL